VQEDEEEGDDYEGTVNDEDDNIDEMDSVDEEEHESLVADTAAVCETVTKVHHPHHPHHHQPSLTRLPADTQPLFCHNPLNDSRPPCLAQTLPQGWTQTQRHPPRCRHQMEFHP
jgi:hypothetical protein